MASLALLVGSGISAASSVAVLGVASASEPLVTQEKLALVVVVGGYVAQIATAWMVEGAIAGGQIGEVALPVAAGAAGLLGSLAMLAGASYHSLLIVGLFLLLPSVEITRAAAVVRSDTRQEVWPAVCLAVSLTLALIIRRSPFEMSWRLMGVGCALAIGMRLRIWKSGTYAMPPRRYYLPIVGETAVTGITQPLLSATIAAGLGPEIVIGFRAVSALGSLLSPGIGFLRLRLLSRWRSRSDIAICCAFLACAVAAVVAVATSRIAWQLFGSSWSTVSTASIVALVGWRLLTVLSTFPFANLRRRGLVRAVLVIRVISTLVYCVLGAVGALMGKITFIFLGFCAAEAATAVMFAVWDRKERRQDA